MRSKNVLQYAIMYQSMRMNMELTRRSGFAGDSGGTNMAMGVCMCLRDEGFDVSKIKGNILYYGGYGLMSSISSYQHGGRSGMEWSEADLSSPSCYIAPDVKPF